MISMCQTSLWTYWKCDGKRDENSFCLFFFCRRRRYVLSAGLAPGRGSPLPSHAKCSISTGGSETLRSGNGFGSRLSSVETNYPQVPFSRFQFYIEKLERGDLERAESLIDDTSVYIPEIALTDVSLSLLSPDCPFTSSLPLSTHSSPNHPQKSSQSSSTILVPIIQFPDYPNPHPNTHSPSPVAVR